MKNAESLRKRDLAASAEHVKQGQRCGQLLAHGHQSLTTKRRKLSAVLLLFIPFSPANSTHLHLSNLTLPQTQRDFEWVPVLF